MAFANSLIQGRREKMRKVLKLSTLILIIIVLSLNFAVSARAMTLLQSAEGEIVVIGQNAMVNINGTNYFILKENTSYTQFDKRHIKMYNIHIDYINGFLIIDFNGFRFIDAFV
jgi:hypothetical protein